MDELWEFVFKKEKNYQTHYNFRNEFDNSSSARLPEQE